jgi:cytochrome c-type biogenesis protein CcmH/NrfG
MEFIVRNQSTILLVSFVVFVLGLLGFTLWQSNTREPLANVSKEQRESDLKRAEQYLQDSEAERSLPIIHEHKEEMEKDTPEGKKWLSLFVDASSQLKDVDQLHLIYQFNPEPFKNNEQAALTLAESFIKSENPADYTHLRQLWKKRENNEAAWILLDADLLLQQGEKQKAYDLLKNQKWQGKPESERLMRLTLISWKENPEDALSMLNAEYSKDPKNLEIRLLRGQIYESLNKLSLAEQDLNTVAQLDPGNIYLQDQLAEFYRRQKNYVKAETIWQKILAQTSNEQIWMKSLFWNQVAAPVNYDWKNTKLADTHTKAFFNYLLKIRPDQFWDKKAFEKVHRHLDALSHYQATYWLRLLQALKNHDEQAALSLIHHNPFEGLSWAPLLEINLQRILNYRHKGSLLIEGDAANTDSILKLLSLREPVPALYKKLDELAQQEADLGAAFKLPDDMQALLNNPEIFAVAFFSEGWTEAALRLQPIGTLSADFPEWVPVLYIHGLRQNRGNASALQFIAEQKPLPMVNLLKAEIQIAEGRPDQALPCLEKLKSNPTDLGARAAWLLCQIDMQKGEYRKAAQAIESHPQLSQALQGQETLARIAVMEGKPEVAGQIYEKIVGESNEAKSFLARRAFQQKDWTLARQLTEELLNDYPGNAQLQENLKKINQALALQK